LAFARPSPSYRPLELHRWKTVSNYNTTSSERLCNMLQFSTEPIPQKTGLIPAVALVK
jgi:hypothetical protein